MSKVWLLVAFVVVMLLIGRGWQGEPLSADAVDDRAAAAGAARP